MRIGLSCFEFHNNDIAYNLSKIEKGLQKVSGQADLLCFGEAFLQGFDALSWDFETDRSIAVPMDSECMRSICRLSGRYGVDLIFGYLELDGIHIYSSCAVIENGVLTHNYRRISRGWKECSKADSHYREGDNVVSFPYRESSITLALCGDLWDEPERFRTDGIVIWPVYVNLTPEEWKRGEETDYAKQAQRVAERVLMVDSYCRETAPDGVAGTCVFLGGSVAKKAENGFDHILLVDI